ncbi:MAG: sulfatase-like hydrolase/transferase [Betaproteobacteria bacterium]|nr:sulfatase-like hydrolase/transferase [Betaproteobacteria bacterium]
MTFTFSPRKPAPRLLVALGAAALVTWTLLRLALWLATGPEAAGWENVAGLFARGLGFDVATLAFALVPWLLASAVLPDRWRGAGAVVALRWACLWLTISLLLFGAVAEWVFWTEFSTRFNFIAVDYLVYTHEVIGNIRQSYPVPAILAAIGIVAFVLAYLLSRRVRLAASPLGVRRRLALAALAVALPAASLAVANVDQQGGSGNAYADELAGNGLFTFWAAFRRNELDYDKFYRTIDQAKADAILLSLGVEREPLGEALKPDENEDPVAQLGPLLRRPRNVVLVSVESLSAEFLGTYGNGKGLTPNLDRLASEGLRFDRFFATGTRTVRGLEALSLGVPPVPGQSIVRRPDNEHLATVGEFLEHQGFYVAFVYGGYGYFDNMNAYFKGNDYEIVDRSDFPKESVVFENVWGVADEVLFTNALAAFDKASAKSKPFFAHIMTTSNHRPFTYPEGRIDIAPPGGREGGVKYTDYAIGRFIREARTKPWFADTLFILTADHCASVAGKSRLPVGSYRIPLILYGPGIVPPGVNARLASQIDLPPTILDLLGRNGDDHFFGQGLFEDEKLPARAFVSNYQELGYYKDDNLTVLLPKQKVEAFRIDPKTYAATPAEPDPRQVEEAIAYYQTASRAFRLGKLKNPDYRGTPVAPAR